MRFIFAIIGTVLTLGSVSVAQDIPASGVQLPARRVRGRQIPQQLPPSETETLPPIVPNQNGVGNAVDPRFAQSMTAPGAAQPNSNSPNNNASRPQPPQAGAPAGAAPAATAPGEAQAQVNLAPPTPPQVTYRDGQLTVQALNSTLSSVLTAIRNKTGIQFEGLDAGSERIVVSMGPAPEGEVLASILSGSHYDYVAVDRPDSPGIVQRVILTPRAGASSPATIAGSAPASSADEEEAADDDPDNLRAPQDTPARPPVMQAQPIPPPNPQPQANPPAPAPATPPSVEQLTEELKQIQQRQQQLQQQAGPQKVPQ